MGKPALKHTHHARAGFRIFNFWIARIDIHRQFGFFQNPMRGIFISGQGAIGWNAQTLRCLMRKALSIGDQSNLVFETPFAAFICNEVRICPDRLAILAPVKCKSPTRQAFARIPFALPIMQKTAGRETLA